MTPKYFLLFSWLLVACTSNDNKHSQQAKPKSVPEGSFWTGGVDGGNWYYIKEINNHRNMVRIAVYNDQDGRLIVDKRFMLICNSDKQTFINDLKNQISSYDGEKIYINKLNSVDCYLQPVK